MWLTHFLRSSETCPSRLQNQSVSSTVKTQRTQNSLLFLKIQTIRYGFKCKMFVSYTCVSPAARTLHFNYNYRMQTLESNMTMEVSCEKNPVERQLKHHCIMRLGLGWVMWRENGGGADANLYPEKFLAAGEEEKRRGRGGRRKIGGK